MLTTAEDMRDARRIVADLRPPKPHIYFTDLAVTASIAWGAVALAILSPGGWSVVFTSLVAGLALNRAVLFAHELSHQKDAIPGLRPWWNALVGVPFLFPSFIYEHVHRAHHRPAIYRTELDPEHAPDGRSLLCRVAGGQLTALALPILMLLRWMVLAPLSVGSPRLRAVVLRRFSSLTSNAKYIRSEERPRYELWLEIACALWSHLIGALAVIGWIPWSGPGALLLGIAVAASVSSFRGEVLHRFRDRGFTGTLERQVLDSVNVPSTNLVTRLLFPMGIGYHALHHLVPSLPYHAIEEAHARLARAFGDGSFYQRTTERDLGTAIWNALAEVEERSRGRAARLPSDPVRVVPDAEIPTESFLAAFGTER